MKSGRLVHGVGINDVAEDYKNVFYKVWASILERCYSSKFHKENLTYADCSICDEWKVYSAFKIWMMTQDYEGRQLDKDLLFKGNKVYSPKTCVFVNSATNSLLTDSAANRGRWPLGVTYCKRQERFSAQCSKDGKGRNLGYFKTSKEAESVYLKFKSSVVVECANRQSDIRVKNALIERAEDMMEKADGLIIEQGVDDVKQ
jgi:hypothetical protein